MGVPSHSIVWCDRYLEGFKMDSTTLLIIIILVIILAGGGWYGRGRWF